MVQWVSRAGGSISSSSYAHAEHVLEQDTEPQIPPSVCVQCSGRKDSNHFVFVESSSNLPVKSNLMFYCLSKVNQRGFNVASLTMINRKYLSKMILITEHLLTQQDSPASSLVRCWSHNKLNGDLLCAAEGFWWSLVIHQCLQGPTFAVSILWQTCTIKIFPVKEKIRRKLPVLQMNHSLRKGNRKAQL